MNDSESVKSDDGLKTKDSIRCLVVGDGFVGKTSLLHVYVNGTFPETYEPTVFDNYAVSVKHRKKLYNMELYDSAGQEEWDQLRMMMYPQTNVFLVCYSCVQPASFDNVEKKWIPELRQYSPKALIILVCTMIDLRSNREHIERLKTIEKSHPVTQQEGMNLARKTNCDGFIECSSIIQFNVNDIFTTVVSLFHKKRYHRGQKKLSSSSQHRKLRNPCRTICCCTNVKRSNMGDE